MLGAKTEKYNIHPTLIKFQALWTEKRISLKNNLTVLSWRLPTLRHFPILVFTLNKLQPGMTYEHRHCGGRRSAPLLMYLVDSG
jgi:hypothetical protein